MSEAVFNAYLYLFAPNGDLLAEDDDGGGGTNARIPARGGMFSLPVDGTYKVYATSHSGNEIGNYTIVLSSITPIPTPAPAQELRVATEADNEYVMAKGGPAAAHQAILSILNQVEGLFEVELGLTVRVAYQSTWNTTNDPYSSTNASALLGELASFWNANRGSVARDLAHMWTGKQLDNATIGTAYLEALCRFTGGGRAAYGLSSSVLGVQQIAITAHEMGHNLGATHPNQQVPQPLGCDNTVMSSNVSTTPRLDFCPYSVNEIATYLAGSANCLRAAASHLNFAVPKSLPIAGPFDDFAVGDFNNDGKQDLVARHLEGITILLGSDGGDMVPTFQLPFGSSPVVGDFDDDGKEDIVVNSPTGGTVTFLRGDGLGGFTPGGESGSGGR